MIGWSHIRNAKQPSAMGVRVHPIVLGLCSGRRQSLVHWTTFKKKIIYLFMYVCPVTLWFKIGKGPLPTILSQLCWKMEPVTKEISSSYLKAILRAPSRYFDCILILSFCWYGSAISVPLSWLSLLFCTVVKYMQLYYDLISEVLGYFANYKKPLSTNIKLPKFN